MGTDSLHVVGHGGSYDYGANGISAIKGGRLMINEKQKQTFQNEYMPYIIKWGKITWWLSIPLVFIPTAVLILLFEATITAGQILAAFIPLFANMLAWDQIDPIDL